MGGNLTIPSYDESTQKITMAYATEFTALTSTSGKFTSISLSGFLAGALTKVSISWSTTPSSTSCPMLSARWRRPSRSGSRTS
ncbi:hypothetical protein M5E87_21305 [Flavonifractor plautii]|nr:hypothetical protein M5E87_21305 [Flavonifractor plautii]